MRSTSALCQAAMVAAPVLADVHYLYAGYFDEAYISGIEFDDAANTLTLVNNYSVTSGSSRWIAADHRLETLYVAGDGIYQSYSIGADGRSLTPAGANVSDTAACTLGVSLAVQPTPSYSVFGVAYDAGCSGVAMRVDDADANTGALVSTTTVTNLTYDAAAGVHGLAASPDGRHVYSADDMGSRVWAHAISSSSNDSTGSIAAEVIGTPLSAPGARHLAVHPGGRWLYVVYESANELAAWTRDADTGAVADTNTTFSLLPDEVVAAGNGSLYWSSDVAVSNATSEGPRYLFAFARARSDDAKGWVNGFALDEETGAITGRIFVEEANGSGGTTNAVTPSSFSEEYFSVTDEGSNYVEVWKVADNGTSASAVAHLDLESGPVNSVWYS